MEFNNGGQEVIKRLLQAYGLTTRKALCDQLGVSTSTMSTRWMRDIFPADWVIQCAIETKASLEWLSFGIGEVFPQQENTTSSRQLQSANDTSMADVIAVPRKKIIDGRLYDSSFYMLDKAMIPENLLSPAVIFTEQLSYLAELKFNDISDGTWVVEIENQISIREIYKIPVKKLRVIPISEGTVFECKSDEVKLIAKCSHSLLKKI